MRIAPSFKPRQLIAYFSSGWAFLIPYLATYLLYNWRKWPANAMSSTSVEPGIIGSNSSVFHFATPPPLLHVYWVLHAVHLVLAAVALRSWWKAERDNAEPVFDAPSLPSSALSLSLRILPWFLLALVFYIPGVYLEWPSDPWEHFRRITEWATHAVVANHSAGYKSLYFFAYSFVGQIPPATQLFWLNVYYTGMCLLLAWQYYLLAKAVGLDRRWAFLSVIVNVLAFGNVCFSFYRYYGLASTVFAQIGAVALTRIVLEALTVQRKQGTENSAQAASQREPVSHLIYCGFGRNGNLGDIRSILTRSRLFSLAVTLCVAVLLTALIAFNHVQGIGIAGLSIASIAVWRLLQWKRSMLWWLSGVTLVLSVATILWWPRHPLINSAYRPYGWLNVWYGFNLFAWPSPAADRAMQILGLFGVINLMAGILLLWRNHVVGWLTVGPVLALLLPVVAIPFANSLGTKNAQEIEIYHRLIYAIPSGFAIVMFARALKSFAGHLTNRQGRSLSPILFRLASLAGFSSLLLCLCAAVTVPSNSVNFNRTWQALAVIPDDLMLKPVWNGVEALARLSPELHSSRITSMSQGGSLANLQNIGHALVGSRGYARGIWSPTDEIILVKNLLDNTDASHPTRVILFDPTVFFSVGSLAGICSGHWLAQGAIFSTAGTSELRALSAKVGLRSQSTPEGSVFFSVEIKKP